MQKVLSRSLLRNSIFMEKQLVVLSGAGISAESGIRTFRASDGLWEDHRIEDVATPEAFRRDPELVLEFYNIRRKQAMQAQPNLAHKLLAELQQLFNVQIITQNIDDLHERAGCENVLHLHGEIMKARSSIAENDFYPVPTGEIQLGDSCRYGSQLRPHIVWFGESVPLIETAQQLTEQADILLVIGTSLSVYPAAGLVHSAPDNIPRYLIDPGTFSLADYPGLHHIQKTATEGMQELLPKLKALA